MMVSSRIENCHLSRSQACKMVSEATSQRGERFSIQYGEQPPRNLSRASHNGIPLPLTERSIATREKRATIQAWLEKAGAEDGTTRPVDLRERSDLKKEKPPKGFERSDAGGSNLLSWPTQEDGEQIPGARKAERN